MAAASGQASGGPGAWARMAAHCAAIGLAASLALALVFAVAWLAGCRGPGC